jgi:hypothetical protein
MDVIKWGMYYFSTEDIWCGTDELGGPVAGRSAMNAEHCGSPAGVYISHLTCK